MVNPGLATETGRAEADERGVMTDFCGENWVCFGVKMGSFLRSHLPRERETAVFAGESKNDNWVRLVIFCFLPFAWRVGRLGGLLKRPVPVSFRIFPFAVHFAFPRPFETFVTSLRRDSIFFNQLWTRIRRF